MKLPIALFLGGALTLGVAVAQDTAKQDMKDAGHATKEAGKDVGHGTAKGAKAVGHGTKEGAKDVGHGAKDVGHATKSTTKKVFGHDDKKTDDAPKTEQKNPPVQ